MARSDIEIPGETTRQNQKAIRDQAKDTKTQSRKGPRYEALPLLQKDSSSWNSVTFLLSVTFPHITFGFPVSKLSPKKWGVSGSSSLVLIALLAGVSILLNQGIDIRPNLAAILGLSMLDAIFLGGSCLAQISSYWPPYKRRILVHEAGHLLVAYLMGCQFVV
ncbi:hypothetical protein Salat_0290600 [Sesamum alatum]|uniref:Uncharacterized protein n=1 Tax=Sesamum alatum TaxID=300844 RepID=A0AAE1Z0D3_9LAMI|nr:hypothetical protein Salat_0290600 [Sesamum alatum]